MAKTEITDAVVEEFLDRAQEMSMEAHDLAEALSKQIGLNTDKPAARVSAAAHVALRFSDLASRLSSIARHAEDITQLKASLRAEVG